MTNIRPKDLPVVTAPAAGDKLMLDGATARSILVTDFIGATTPGSYNAGTGLILTLNTFSIDGTIVGRLATANTWALAQTFTVAPVFTDAVGSRTALGLGSIATFPEMTAAQYLNNTAGKALSTDKVWAAAVTVALTDAATVTMDFSTFINAKLTGTGGVGTTRTLGAASGGKVGQSGVIEWFPVTGALTLVIPTGSSYVAAGGVSTLVLSNTNGARDAIAYAVLNDGKILLSVNKALAA